MIAAVTAGSTIYSVPECAELRVQMANRKQAMRVIAATYLHPLVFSEPKGNHEHEMSCVFEALPQEPVRGRVRVSGLKSNPPEEQVACIFGAWQTHVSPGGVKVETGAKENTWDAIVSFESQEAAQEACALVHGFIPDAEPMAALEPPSPIVSSERALSSSPTCTLTKRQSRQSRQSSLGPHKLIREANKSKTLSIALLPPSVFAAISQQWLPADMDGDSKPDFDPQSEFSASHMLAWSTWRYS